MALDKLVDSTQLDADLTSVSNAIRTKGGTSASLAFPADFVSAIAAIPTGGGGDDSIPNLKDVVFVDYDGTIVQQYTKAEFLALDSLPSNPSHSGLTAQGWNWTLADAKAYVTANGTLVVGQSYKTDDDKTRVYITVTDATVGALIYIGVTTTVKGSVTIDWGDGNSTTTTANANSYGSYSHGYTSAGDYIIKLSCSSGTYQLGGSGINQQFIRNSGETMRRAVTKVEIANNVTQLHRDCFQYCRNLGVVSIPTSVTTIGSSTYGAMFSWTGIFAIILPSGSNQSGGYLCGTSSYGTIYRLRFVSMPKSFTGAYILSDGGLGNLLMCSIPERATNSGRPFYGAESMQKVSIPGTYTSVQTSFLRECRTVRKVIIPASVTSIAQHALYPMDNIREYHFLPTSPPALASASNMFTVNSNVKIYVPYSADHSILNAYQTASNWASFASYIEEEPQ